MVRQLHVSNVVFEIFTLLFIAGKWISGLVSESQAVFEGNISLHVSHNNLFYYSFITLLLTITFLKPKLLNLESLFIFILQFRHTCCIWVTSQTTAVLLCHFSVLFIFPVSLTHSLTVLWKINRQRQRVLLFSSTFFQSQFPLTSCFLFFWNLLFK